MRAIMQVSLPVQDFNALVRNGTAGQKLSRILDELKPEAVYFTEINGLRGAIIVIDLKDASQIPALAEPWFLTFNAKVEFKICMTPDDLAKAGLDELGKKYG
jgi:hypothetical protein